MPRPTTIIYAAAAIMLASIACPRMFTQTAATISNDRGTYQTIDQLMADIRSARRPLPAWALDTALRAYAAYKAYQNGKKIEQVQQTVFAILTEIRHMKTQLEQGREITELEHRLTRDILDAHVRRLDNYSGRISQLETTTQELNRRLRRPGCGFGHAWRNGKCVNVALYPK